MDKNQEFIAFLSSDIPSALRPIALFLNEAQRSLRWVIDWDIFCLDE